MNLVEALTLLAAGLAAGTVNAIAGGGSLIVFPSLMGVGLGSKAANVTNSLAVSPGYLASVYGSRHDLAELAAERGRRVLMALIPTAAIGSFVGCQVLLHTPQSAFDVVVPFLVLGATVVLAFQQRLKAVAGHPRNITPRRRNVSLHAMVGLASVYGGYFGAALGIVLIAVLGLLLDEELARINALKNAISTVVGLVTVLVFALFGPVDWIAVGIVAPASLVGGYVGARLARRMPQALLRAVIVVVGLSVGVALLLKAF